MAEVISPLPNASTSAGPRQIPERTNRQTPSLPAASHASHPESFNQTRSGHLNLDTFSPVNQNGSFEFDRVLKSGKVMKRTRKTKSWKPFHLVLRPNLLNLYKDEKEEKLHKHIILSDVTAVAYLEDPKRRRDFIFGVFTPSRNYHFQAADKKQAQEWVELIRREARIDEEEQEMFLASPGGQNGSYQGFERDMGVGVHGPSHHWREERLASSSPEPFVDGAARSAGLPSIQRHTSHNMEYSGNEIGSCSEFSDTAGPVDLRGSSVSLSRGPDAGRSSHSGGGRPDMGRNDSQMSGLDILKAEERVVWQGWLLCLRSKGGVRSWKKLWTVLRPKQLAFYKDTQEYLARHILPLDKVINAVEIDPLSKSKRFCFQIIAEAKTYRFCVEKEEDLANWLGGLKSLLAKRDGADRNLLVAGPICALPR
ncbi:MAG: hypothetical protein M1819_000319 [Sarea resinae]|nr:MAG: hypothetical protein M1819_000319 [Sarea resinae]